MALSLVKNVNLKTHPGSDPAYPPSSTNQFTLGDLHGNALKLVSFLINKNVINVSPEDYQALADIYFETTEYLVADNLTLFKSILEKITANPVGLVRLIGDELADRGSNDYFTLLILKKLVDSNVNIELTMSNHSIEFVRDREAKRECVPPLLSIMHAESMFNTATLVRKGLVTEAEIDLLYVNTYTPIAKLLSYSINNENTKITLYTHAGVDLETTQVIEHLARKLKVNYSDNTIQHLAATIDNINIEFNRHMQQRTLHTLMSDNKLYQGYCGDDVDPQTSPIEYLLWNRLYSGFKRSAQHPNGYYVDYVHGHDPADITQGNVYNLDEANMLGKSKIHNTGELVVHCCNDQLPKKLVYEKYDVMQREEKISIPSVSSDGINESILANHPSIKNALEAIAQMSLYGEKLRVVDPFKSMRVISLANNLRSRLMNLNLNEIGQQERLLQFKSEFLGELHSCDDIMAKHRKLWKPIVANIAIAITGIGLAALLVRFAYSRLTTGKSCFFFNKTQSQQHIEKVEESFKKMVANTA